jgi:Tetracyclin repressor-like, C-terminal domain
VLHAELTRRREPPLVALTRARDRGQLPTSLDPDLTVDLLAAPFFYRRFVAHRPIPPNLITEVIAQVLRLPDSP